METGSFTAAVPSLKILVIHFWITSSLREKGGEGDGLSLSSISFIFYFIFVLFRLLQGVLIRNFSPSLFLTFHFFKLAEMVNVNFKSSSQDSANGKQNALNLSLPIMEGLCDALTLILRELSLVCIFSSSM